MPCTIQVVGWIQNRKGDCSVKGALWFERDEEIELSCGSDIRETVCDLNVRSGLLHVNPKYH